MPSPLNFATVDFKRLCWFFCWPALLLASTGCGGTTCFVGVINPPNNGVQITNSNIPAVCSQPRITAAVKMLVTVAPSCTNCTSLQQVSGISLAVTGIELHPGAVAEENSPEWHEVAPHLSGNPMRIDLVAAPALHPVMLPLSATGHIPSGQYYLLRVRLAESSSLQSADGSIHSLQPIGSKPYVNVPLSSPFVVSSDHGNELHINLYPEWGLVRTPTGAIELAPQLFGQVSSSNAALAN